MTFSRLRRALGPQGRSILGEILQIYTNHTNQFWKISVILSRSDTRYKPNRYILKDLKRFVRFLSRSDTRYQIAYGECLTLATLEVLVAYGEKSYKSIQIIQIYYERYENWRTAAQPQRAQRRQRAQRAGRQGRNEEWRVKNGEGIMDN